MTQWYPTQTELLTDDNGVVLTSTVAKPSSSVNTPSIQTGATALAATAAGVTRKSFMIQNVGTNPLFILLGSGASTSVFNALIKGGTADSDGLGGSYSPSGFTYSGIVTVAGTSPKYVVTEIL